MTNVETTRHFNVCGFGDSFIDEICMKINEVDFVSAKIYGDEEALHDSIYESIRVVLGDEYEWC